jgi:hypothetical protein
MVESWVDGERIIGPIKMRGKADKRDTGTMKQLREAISGTGDRPRSHQR